MELMDEELIEQLKEKPSLQFLIGLEAFQYSAPFDPSMMVFFRKHLPESVVNECNERIVRHELSVIRSSAADEHRDNNSDGGGMASTADQEIEAWPEVGAFYWTVPSPDNVNSGREEQGLISV